MHAIWTGNISFGLVSIPVKLVAAIESKEEEHFSLFCAEHRVPVHYKRWCEKGEHDVPWDEVVKGMEVASGKYFLFTKEKIDSLKPSTTDELSIEEFVSADQLDPLYIEKQYYLMPAGTHDKAYFLFQEALQETEKVAVARFVLREREHIAVIGVHGHGLLLTTLHYIDEVRETARSDELRNRPKLDAEELKLAKGIIDKHTRKTLDIDRFKDDFTDKLKKLAHGKSVKVEKVELPKHESLMDALKASVK